FSHIVEYGLQGSVENEYQDHEVVGQRLSKLILSEVLDKGLYNSGIRKDFPIFTQCAFHVCMEILAAQKPECRFFELKASFLAGDIDADRLDYVRRDIESTGMTATTYDLGRILDSIKLVYVEGEGMMKKARAVFTTKTLSSLETFFTARFHLYRWAIFHHDVSRRNLCMQRFVLLLLTSDAISSEISEIADRLRSFASKENLWKYK
ncbi:MAG: hypothetical protein AAF498_15815, partial [Pseudomonadota bacterium]